MPKVPIYNERQVAPQGFPRARFDERASDESFGASVGRALEHAANVANDIRLQEARKADQAALLEADNQLDTFEQSSLFDPDTGAYAKQGKDAFDLPNQVLPGFDTEARRIEGTLGSDRAKQVFRANYLNRRQAINERLNQREYGERERFYDEQDQAKLDSSRAMAGNYYSDPERIGVEIAKQEAVIDAMGDRKGWPAEKVDAAKVVARSETHVDVVQRYLSRGEWRKGEIYFEEARAQIAGDAATRIEAALTVERRRAEDEAKSKLTEARQTLNDQVRDIMAAAELGIPVTEAPSKAVLTAVFGQHEGEQRHRIVQMATKLSTQVNELNSLPTDELVKRVQEFKPTGVEGAADQALVYGTVARSVAHIVEQRAKDPAGYLTQNAPATQKAWITLNEATGVDQPAAAQAYLSAVRADRERLQLPGDELLPDQYAQQVADRINTAATAGAMTNSIEQEAARWGAAWPQVYGQLAPKMTGTAAVIGSGITRSAATTLATMAPLKEAELKAILPPSTKWSDVELAVDDVLGDFQRSFGVDGIATYSAFREAAVRLAVKNIQDGMERSDAAEKAYQDLVTHRYELVDSRSVTYRVPVERSVGAISHGAETALAQYQPKGSEIDIPPGSALTQEEYLGHFKQYVREHGYWMTKPDGEGLRLYVDGGPVAGPFDLAWSTLEALSASTSRDVKQPTFDELRGFGGRGL